MRILIAPDSFKGSLTAKEVALTIEEAFQTVIPDAKIKSIPMADGGEGTMESLIFATDGKMQPITVTGPLLKPVKTAFGYLGDGITAVVETANICGLTMVPKNKRNPLYTTSYGLGEAIRIALDHGFRRIIIGLGGSATNDGGLGMLQALGMQCLDAQQQVVKPIGQALHKITSISTETLDPRLKETELIIASDVSNPLCGPNGASHVFGLQKGATPKIIKQLDQALMHFANLIESAFAKKVQDAPGAGAAGGLGFAFLLLNGKMHPGAEVVAMANQLENCIQQIDWVITGEGRSDFQTSYGKLPLYVATIAKKYFKPTILISGSIADDTKALEPHFVSMHSIICSPITLTEACQQASTLLYNTTYNIAKLIHYIGKFPPKRAY